MFKIVLVPGHRLDWLCCKIELSVRHTIGKIETENARFHAIIQADISIRSFDQNALSVYFFVCEL